MIHIVNVIIKRQYTVHAMHTAQPCLVIWSEWELLDYTTWSEWEHNLAPHGTQAHGFYGTSRHGTAAPVRHTPVAPRTPGGEHALLGELFVNNLM